MELIDIGLIIGYIALFVAIASAIILPLISAIKQPAGLLRPVLFIVGIVVLFGIGYALSSSNISLSAASMGITETGTKLIGAGLILFYISLIVAVLGVAYSEISKSMK